MKRITIILAALITYAVGCTINVNGGLGEPQPLLVWPGTSTFVEPQGTTGIITLTAGQSIETYCTSFTTTTCQSNGQFLINGVVRPFDQIVCSAYSPHTVRRTGRTCYGGATVFEIGFVAGTRFLSLIEACHDENKESTLYVKFQQNKSNVGYQKNFPRPNFITGGFFGGKNVDNLYTKNNQIEVFTKILGSAVLANNLVQTTGDGYLARGHLAAKVDFIFGSQQKATFYFVNAAPQWQKFNAVNWESVEDGLRQFVANRGTSVDIYTGTFGVMTAADVGGVHRELYLYLDGTTGKIPVPKIFYKIAIEPSTRLGIAIIGVNNPHVSLAEINASYRLCDDISSRITWLNWDPTNIAKGYSYACDVNQLAAKLGHLPSLSVSGLLL